MPVQIRLSELVCTVALLAMAAGQALAGCQATSGSTANIPVELYTSEGCDSCPPADRWLSGLRDGNLIPLAFHVDYWDHLGWRDPFASPVFTQRQQERLRTSGARFAYTPQVVVGGRDHPGWRRQAPAGRPADAAGADISIESLSAANGVLRFRVVARLREPATAGVARAYLALLESGLVSQVGAGENRGARLLHDHVVRIWSGPLSFAADGRLELVQTWRRPDVAPERAALVAIVETVGGRVLQALKLPLCP